MTHDRHARHDRAVVPQSELQREWRAVLASVLGVAFGMSAMGLTYTLGAFVKPLTQEFGWSRQDVFSVTVFATLAVVPASLLAGWIVDRYGVRRLVIGSQLGLGAVFMMMGVLIDGLRMLYLLYFLLPALSIGTTPITFAKVVTARFERQRGFALGLVLAGTGLCALVVPPYLAWVIRNWGWRVGYLTIGLLPLVIALPAAWAWIRDLPIATSGDGTESAPQAGLSAGEAYRSWRFWVMALAFLAVSAGATGLITNAVPLLTERGHSPVRAAAALSLFGVAVVAGRITFGWLVDRFWAPLVGLLFLAPAGLAIVSLIPSGFGLAANSVALFVAGLATGAELDLCAYLTSRYFGLRAYGRIYGALFIVFAAGAGIIGPVCGALFDRLHRYDEILVILAGGYVGCALLLLTLGRFPDFSSRPRGDDNSLVAIRRTQRE